MKNGQNEICFIVDRFEGNRVILKWEDQELVMPKKLLPRDIEEGDVLNTEFFTDKVATKRRENIAKAILEEILRGE